MANLVRYYSRGRHPERFFGKRALKKMNSAKHAALPEWVLDEYIIKDDTRFLDIGCGGGANLNRILTRYPTTTAVGMDIAKDAMDLTREVNYRDIVDKRCLLLGGDATQMPLAKESFDLVTAFETIYYWDSMEANPENSEEAVGLYFKLADTIRSGKPGYGEFDEFDMFDGCSSLAAIQAGNANITAEGYNHIGNPNLLVYVNDASLAPQSVQNVVVNL